MENREEFANFIRGLHSASRRISQQSSRVRPQIFDGVVHTRSYLRGIFNGYRVDIILEEASRLDCWHVSIQIGMIFECFDEQGIHHYFYICPLCTKECASCSNPTPVQVSKKIEDQFYCPNCKKIKTVLYFSQKIGSVIGEWLE